MHFSLITLFPEYFSGPLSTGLMQKGVESGIVSFSFHNPRDTTTDPHKTVDDRPYGGGPGMVMLPLPLATVIERLGYKPLNPLLPSALGSPDSSIQESCPATPASILQRATTCNALQMKAGNEKKLDQQSVLNRHHGTVQEATLVTDLEASLEAGVATPSHEPATLKLEMPAKEACREGAKNLCLAGQAAGRSTPCCSSQAVPPQPGRLIYLSPKGRPLTQSLVKELATEKHITLICGRYEGIDSRIEDIYPVERISIGDFVLNGGEAGAACLMEAVSRLLPGFMGHDESGTEESFSDSLLEYKQYTRPERFGGISVPPVLRSGNHEAIARYRHEERLAETLYNRPDLIEKATLTPGDRHFIRSLRLQKPAKNLYCALVHYPVLDKYKNTVAVSLTNLDIHDICRSSCTYGLGGCFMVTPINDQHELLTSIVRHWTSGPGGASNPDRKVALEKVYGVWSLSEAIDRIEEETGRPPLVFGTTAVVPATGKRKKEPVPAEISLDVARKKLYSHPVLLLFGTGHGLAPEAKAMCHGFLPPIRWHGEYNHLSVRSACAIIFDRLLGDWL